MIEDFGHVWRNSVSATPALLIPKKSESANGRRTDEREEQTYIEEVWILFKDKNPVTYSSQGISGGQTG